MCVQINEKLQQTGTIAIPSLTKVYDLPAEFLIEQVHARLGSIIEGFKDETDPKVLLTTSHVARNRARIRGVLSAVTVPTSLGSIINRFGFQVCLRDTRGYVPEGVCSVTHDLSVFTCLCHLHHT